MKKQKNKLLCACGCTQEVPDKWSYKANRPVIFIRGHNVKGRKLSEGALKKLRVIWNSEAYKIKKRSERLGSKHSEETIRKMSEAMIVSWKNRKKKL